MYRKPGTNTLATSSLLLAWLMSTVSCFSTEEASRSLLGGANSPLNPAIDYLEQTAALSTGAFRAIREPPTLEGLLKEHGGEGGQFRVLKLTHHLKRMGEKGEQTHVALLESDKIRHGVKEPEMNEEVPEHSRQRVLQQNSAAKEPIFGATFPNGLYYANLGIGTPPQYLNLNLDTGSNLLWVNCEPCQPCTQSQSLTQNDPFSPSQSSSARSVPCNSSTCTNPDTTVKTFQCGDSNSGGGSNSGSTGSPCGYQVTYADLSSTTGSLYTDVLHLPTAKGDVPVPLTVGCGNTQTGNFLNGPGWTYYESIDGLLGLGRGLFSVMTAIKTQGKALQISPKLTHCLGGDQGGGWVTFGDVPLPLEDMPFTQILPDATWYKVSILRISVGGRPVSVSPSEYGNVTSGNAILDSGTTFSILPDPFVTAILNIIQDDVGLPRYTFSQTDSGTLCFAATPSLSVSAILKLMPQINVQFVGRNVFLNVPPTKYTFATMDGTKQLVCTQLNQGSTFQSAKGGVLFIVGDIWMRDLAVTYDLAQNMAGWTAMKC